MTTDTFQDPFLGMLKHGTHSVADFLLTIGIALVVIGAIALVAPLASGVLFLCSWQPTQAAFSPGWSVAQLRMVCTM